MVEWLFLACQLLGMRIQVESLIVDAISKSPKRVQAVALTLFESTETSYLICPPRFLN